MGCVSSTNRHFSTGRVLLLHRPPVHNRKSWEKFTRFVVEPSRRLAFFHRDGMLPLKSTLQASDISG